MDKPQWLKARQSYIGGTDLASIWGLNPYKSRLQVWMEKTGASQPPDIDDKIAVEVGKILEDYVAYRFTKATGLQVTKSKPYYTRYHPQHKFMGANTDFEGRDPQGKPFILECKTTSVYNDKLWKDDNIPEYYELQLLHYLVVTGCEYGYIACLIGNHKFVHKRVDIDDNLRQMIIDKCCEFWEMVEKKQMPAADGSEACSNLLSDLYPQAVEESSIELTDTCDLLIQKRNDLKSQVKSLEEEINLIDNSLKMQMGDNEIGYTQNFKVSWKNITSKKLNIADLKTDLPDIYQKYLKTSTTRRFEIK